MSYLTTFRLLLLIELALIAVCVWPGLLSPDSHSQWDMALNHVYSDHHPPMMSVIWGIFLPLSNSPAWILILHLGFLGLGLDYLARSFEDSKHLFALLLIPVFPQVLVYLGCIWKDVAMATSFFTVACLLTSHTLNKTRLTGFQVLVAVLLMFYGSAVKYQGQFCVLILILWLFYIQSNSWAVRLLTLIKSFCAWGLLILGVSSFNNFYVRDDQKNHSWQYVKFFDLAAISVDTHHDYLPDVFKNPNYSFKKLQQLANHQRVDDLVFGVQGILRKSMVTKDHDQLKAAWGDALLEHPFIYLKHRFLANVHIYGSIPGCSHYLEFIKTHAAPYPSLLTALDLMGRGLGLLLLSHLLIPFFCLFYLGVGIKHWTRSAYGQSLFFINLTSFMLMGVLFFFSMAGTSRYTYLCALFTTVSHVLAFRMIKRP